MNLETMTKDEAIEAVIASLDSLPDDLSDADITRTAMQIRRVCGNAYAVDWTRAAKGARRQQERPEQTANALAIQPGDEGLLELPPGYMLQGAEVWQGDTLVTSTLAVVTKRLRDIESGDVMVELAWYESGTWTSQIVPRSTIADARKIGRLADRGLSVTSGSAALLVAYLEEFQRANRAILPTARVSSRCGWVGKSFLLGSTCYGPTVALQPEPGMHEISDHYGKAGSYAEWRRFMHDTVAPRPLLLLAAYISMVAPLLEVLEVPGFGADWSGRPGTGKSTALMVASSVWGCPGNPNGKLIRSWESSSSYGPTTVAAYVCNLPIILDDTNKADTKRVNMGQMCYTLPGGESRIMGSAEGGIRRIRRWRTVLLSTGERPLTDYAEGNAGAHRRILCFREPPAGKDGAEPAMLVREVTNEHYGHAGDALIRYLVDADWEDLRARHRALRRKYMQRARNEAEGSLAEALGALELVAALASEVGILDVQDVERAAALDMAWGAVVDGGEGADEPTAALRTAFSWYGMESERFARTAGDTRLPKAGWLGRIDSSYLAFEEVALRKYLEAAGHKAKFCISEWRLRGWLDSTGKRTSKSVRMPGGGTIAAVKVDINAEAVINVCGRVQFSAHVKDSDDPSF